VFNAAWSLPQVVRGYPKTKPAPYGGTNGEYTLPFSKTWVYSGKMDIVHGWTFAGGTLDNKVTWSSSSSRTYYFDGSGSDTGSAASSYRYIPSTRLNNTSTGVTGRCNDSAMSTSTGAYMIAVASVYGKYATIENYRNRILHYTYSYYTAYEAPVIHAVSLKAHETGVDMGTGCNKLHVTAPMYLFPRMTFPKSANGSGYTGYRYYFIPWDASLANVTTVWQGAWDDSVTGAFNLTQAREFITPGGPPKAASAKIHTYQYNPTGTPGNGPYGGSSYYYMNPAWRYSAK